MKAYVARQIDDKHINQILRLIDNFATDGTITVDQNQAFIVNESNVIFMVADTALFPGKYLVRFQDYKDAFFLPIIDKEVPLPVLKLRDQLRLAVFREWMSIEAQIIHLVDDVVDVLFQNNNPSILFRIAPQYLVIEIENILIMFPLDT